MTVHYLFSLPHITIKEACNSWIGNKTIRALYEPVTLVSKAQVLYRHISRPQSSHDLLRFTNRYARIVGPMHDKEWLPYAATSATTQKEYPECHLTG